MSRRRREWTDEDTVLVLLGLIALVALAGMAYGAWAYVMIGRASGWRFM